LRRFLRGMRSWLLRCPLRQTVRLVQTRSLSRVLGLCRPFGLSLPLQTRLLFFNSLLHALARFFARLRTRFREVAILGAMKIGPRVQRCHIFWRIVLVVQRPSISHRSPQNFPAVTPFVVRVPF
jgi:hypothetical protein